MPDAPSSTWSDVALTNDARGILERAVSIATARGAPPQECDAIDVLGALLQVRGTLAERAIRALGVDPASVAQLIPARGASSALPVKQVLVNAVREAQVLGHYQVDSIHLLLAMLYSDSRATSAALQGAGVTLYDLRRHLQTGSRDFLAGAGDRASVDRTGGNRSRPDAALRRKPLPSLRGVLSVSPVFLGLLGVTAATGVALFSDILPALEWILVVLFVVCGWIVSLCFHEFAHALVAYLGGDRSVVVRGYLSLNPLHYANVFMSVVLPVAFLLLGGIGLPGGAVYIDHAAIRSRTWDSAVSLAGPVATLLVGLLIAAVFNLPGHEAWLNTGNLSFFAALAFLGFIQVSAVVLNLIPIPGLDGFGIIAPWLPISARILVYRYATFAMIGLFVALWYVPPVRDAYFQTIFHLSAILNIDPNLVYVGIDQMRIGPHL